jgi:hypothetical protein
MLQKIARKGIVQRHKSELVVQADVYLMSR